mmetsp:Transcript_50303/g.145892  ORF Transcript_50303/g.145892 Transcript_50303/m.145892 type:complete len:143 (+) Transcript_50303:62-490(+)
MRLAAAACSLAAALSAPGLAAARVRGSQPDELYLPLRQFGDRHFSKEGVAQESERGVAPFGSGQAKAAVPGSGEEKAPKDGDEASAADTRRPHTWDVSDRIVPYGVTVRRMPWERRGLQDTESFHKDYVVDDQPVPAPHYGG